MRDEVKGSIYQPPKEPFVLMLPGNIPLVDNKAYLFLTLADNYRDLEHPLHRALIDEGFFPYARHQKYETEKLVSETRDQLTKAGIPLHTVAMSRLQSKELTLKRGAARSGIAVEISPDIDAFLQSQEHLIPRSTPLPSDHPALLGEPPTPTTENERLAQNLRQYMTRFVEPAAAQISEVIPVAHTPTLLRDLHAVKMNKYPDVVRVIARSVVYRHNLRVNSFTHADKSWIGFNPNTLKAFAALVFMYDQLIGYDALIYNDIRKAPDPTMPPGILEQRIQVRQQEMVERTRAVLRGAGYDTLAPLLLDTVESPQTNPLFVVQAGGGTTPFTEPRRERGPATIAQKQAMSRSTFGDRSESGEPDEKPEPEPALDLNPFTHLIELLEPELKPERMTLAIWRDEPLKELAQKLKEARDNENITNISVNNFEFAIVTHRGVRCVVLDNFFKSTLATASLLALTYNRWGEKQVIVTSTLEVQRINLDQFAEAASVTSELFEINKPTWDAQFPQDPLTLRQFTKAVVKKVKTYDPEGFAKAKAKTTFEIPPELR